MYSNNTIGLTTQQVLSRYRDCSYTYLTYHYLQYNLIAVRRDRSQRRIPHLHETATSQLRSTEDFRYVTLRIHKLATSCETILLQSSPASCIRENKARANLQLTRMRKISFAAKWDAETKLLQSRLSPFCCGIGVGWRCGFTWPFL